MTLSVTGLKENGSVDQVWSNFSHPPIPLLTPTQSSLFTIQCFPAPPTSQLQALFIQVLTCEPHPEQRVCFKAPIPFLQQNLPPLASTLSGHCLPKHQQTLDKPIKPLMWVGANTFINPPRKCIFLSVGASWRHNTLRQRHDFLVRISSTTTCVWGPGHHTPHTLHSLILGWVLCQRSRVWSQKRCNYGRKGSWQLSFVFIWHVCLKSAECIPQRLGEVVP